MLSSSSLFELIHEPAAYGTVYIFTDFQSSDSVGPSVVAETKAMAEARDATIIPVTLTCDEEENLRRLVEEDRKSQGKLFDAELMRTFRSSPQVHRFSKYEDTFKSDVTEMSTEVAAAKLM